MWIIKAESQGLKTGLNPLNRLSTLMVQGTTSDAGKSTLVAGLCRLLARNAVAVAPFKPQNMALNSAVTANGGEIGRAQAVQAQACHLEPHTDMNPVLIKPSSDVGAQIIIQGQVHTNMEAQNYHAFKPVAKAAVLESFNRLKKQYTTVVVEGAGSPAEINLREGDIANMGFAESVDCPVVLIADIDKGGVFAHIVGTLDLLSASEQNRIVGFVINRFRGDIALLQPGLDWLEAKTQKPVLGVLPYLHNFYLESEDAIDNSQQCAHSELNIVVPLLPRISNHTDFDALRLHPGVNIQFVQPHNLPPACDLIIFPGSKNARQDCAFLKRHGWGAALQKHLRYHGKVIGICGGYQMLGCEISDPIGVEGTAGVEPGFGVLPISTRLEKNKFLTRVQGSLNLPRESVEFSGYEIHHGKTQYLKDDYIAPFVLRAIGNEAQAQPKSDGILSPDNQVLGGYAHGLFDQPAACNALLRWAGLSGHQAVDVKHLQDQQINRLADTLHEHLNMQKFTGALNRFGNNRVCKLGA